MQLSGCRADIGPGEPEGFASSQTEHEDQDVSAVERVAIMLGRFEESSGLVDSPGFALSAARNEPAVRHPTPPGSD
jgi:hypothetical protein